MTRPVSVSFDLATESLSVHIPSAGPLGEGHTVSFATSEAGLMAFVHMLQERAKAKEMPTISTSGALTGEQVQSLIKDFSGPVTKVGPSTRHIPRNKFQQELDRIGAEIAGEIDLEVDL